jgi:predicted nuclease of predicted toxin-antitoxin system
VRFLVDANLSPRVAEWLRSQRHDAAHVFEIGLNEAGDHRILEEAARKRRLLLTVDLDFRELLARSSGRVSVLIVRLRNTATATVSKRLEVALKQAAAALDGGAVVRRLPLGC